MQSLRSQIKTKTLLMRKDPHSINCGRFIIVGANVHCLNTESFIDGEVFRSRKVCLLFVGSRLLCPGKHFRRHKFGKADAADPLKLVFLQRTKRFFKETAQYVERVQRAYDKYTKLYANELG